MSYIRKRGAQLVLAHGRREKGSSSVNQEILFTIYSKAEALEIIRKKKDKPSFNFQHLIERKYPHIKFNWTKIDESIKEGMEILPDFYQYKQERLTKNFRTDLTNMVRQLALNDPQWLLSSAEQIESHRHELEFLIKLIEWRLKTSSLKREKDEWNKDNPFYWLSSTQTLDHPLELEEMAETLYEDGDYTKAHAVFKLLIDTFVNYADGHHYLGLIAFDQSDYDAAILQFRKTVEVGRKKFKKRIPKSQYWSSLSTRPYMRGLRSLAITLNRKGEFDEALQICETLLTECADTITAKAIKSDISLNLGLWSAAAKDALYCCKIHPGCSFNVALASYELNQIEKADIHFLHGALNYPKTAHSILDLKIKGRKNLSSRHEAEDCNFAIDTSENLHQYLSAKRRSSFKHFKNFLMDDKIQAMIEKREQAQKKWSEEKHVDKKNFDIMHNMGELRFAQEVLSFSN